MSTQFHFRKLDARTRALMKEEIERANADGEIYYSARFNAIGTARWVEWLLEAAAAHDEHWLAYQIEAAGAMKDYEGRIHQTAGYTTAHVPESAAETLAEGQFNRFYIAAICCRAIKEQIADVTVYRARQRGVPRSESRALEGTSKNADVLLQQVRTKAGSFKCDLLKPNSGLSVNY